MCNFKVTYTVRGKSFIPADNGKEISKTFDVSAVFSKRSGTYGNGYSMCIEGKSEPFGYSLYDIRYDTGFDPENMIAYILQFYANQYSGENGSWKLTAISVSEA